MKVGMNIVKLQERRSINFSQSDIFSEYCSRMIKFCPYLEPAEKNNVLFSSNYYLDGQSLEDLQESLFYVGVLEIERFRKNRSKYNLNKRLLYCENVIINLPSKFKHIDGSELFAWPHYLLKLLYTQVGIMLGKFWVNEKLISKKGISIPSPTCHFLSIRSTIKSRDPGLLKKTKNFSLILQQSEEKGQNVHHLLPKECELNIQSMKKYNYYQCVLNWGKRRVE